MKKGKVSLRGYPVCSEHGAMNKVSPHGLWRCLMCHVGFNEQRAILKDSTEGFREKTVSSEKTEKAFPDKASVPTRERKRVK